MLIISTIFMHIEVLHYKHFSSGIFNLYNCDLTKQNILSNAI